MSVNLDKLIAASPDPETTSRRMERLLDNADVLQRFAGLKPERQKDLVAIIGISNFLSNLLNRYPDMIGAIGEKLVIDEKEINAIHNPDDLRSYKYRQLLKITWMDVCQVCDYVEVLGSLSQLAIGIVRQTLRLSLNDDDYGQVMKSLAIIAMGKLGANELNYSSDIDLIMVSVNPEDHVGDYQDLQKLLFDSIRRLSKQLEEKNADGFLYRVDLKLRPWGNSGPLVMAIDDTENYYEASSEPWESFAWLRARCIAGSEMLARDLLNRMNPFIFMRSLSTDDLSRFVEIKNEMGKARKRKGHWNVKVGKGGIRDIEFCIQILQMVNGAKRPELQTTNTLSALSGLSQCGLISKNDEKEIYQSYIFLRRLENRLQMIEEKQTHDLPDKQSQRLMLARSLCIPGESNDEILDNFENELFLNRSIAEKYFDRVLPNE